MCGILGIINTKEKIDEGRVLAARDVLAHRGPDDAGIYFSHNKERSLASAREDNTQTPFVALAHRRLSIIDLSPAAHQPMTRRREPSAESPESGILNQATRYAIVFNGEIYNYKELIPRLTSHVSPLTSNSDTEVILNLYAQYGKDCLNMLRGMFAFAIWDDKEKTLFAARDRFGIKPFYYLQNDNEFIFSSELKAINNYKKGLTISNEGIDAFLRTGSVPAPITIYKEVSALLPGHYLEIRDQKLEISKYWEFSDLLNQSHTQSVTLSLPALTDASRGRSKGHPEHVRPAGGLVSGSNTNERTDSRLSTDKAGLRENDKIKYSQSLRGPQGRGNLKYDAEAKKKIREALLDSIRAHMVSDVEVGAFLSGGIDSTSIVSLMRQVGKEKIKTVSIVFPGNKLDESKYSRLAAKKFNTEHIEIPFYEKDLLDDFDKIMSVMDQPTIDGINTYFVSKAAKQAGLKVVLSGLGGDELFGGYPSFNLIPKYKRIKNLPLAKPFMKAAAPLLKNRLPAKAIEYMQNPNTQNSEYRLMRGLFTDDELKKIGWWHAENVISSEARNLKDFSVESSFEMTRDAMPYALSPLQTISMLETCFYMRNQLLRDSDVFSMTHSLELRVPFVDHLLYEVVLPYLDDGFDNNFPKKMLVDAVTDLPDEIVHRPKMGFTFPFADWIMKGQLKHEIFERIAELKKTLNINEVHWSRLWALFVLSKFI